MHTSEHCLAACQRGVDRYDGETLLWAGAPIAAAGEYADGIGGIDATTGAVAAAIESFAGRKEEPGYG